MSPRFSRWIFSVSDVYFFFFYCFADHRDLHSFPTRRSSDLAADHHAARDHQESVDGAAPERLLLPSLRQRDRKSTRLNSSHVAISYAVFCLKKKKRKYSRTMNAQSSDCPTSSVSTKF